MSTTPFGQLPKVDYEPSGGRLEFNDVIGMTMIANSLVWPRLFILGFWIFDRSSARVLEAGRSGHRLLHRAVDDGLYALMWGAGGDSVSGFWEWLVVGVAVLLDVLTWWGIARLRHLRW